MIGLVVFSCLVAFAFGQYQYNPNQQQQHHSSNSAPVHYVNIGQQLQGDYKFGYNTGNDGSFREETRNPDGSVSGAYGYVDASGKQKIIRYTAGKEGFKAEGDDIPKAPASPAAPQNNAYQPPQSYNYVHPQQPANAYQPPQSYNYAQPNNAYQPPPSYNYVQPQQSQATLQYAPSQQGSYNPFAYPNPAQPVSNRQLLSYNIGGGQNNHYQG